MRFTIHGAKPTVITVRDGGVGSLDEDLSSKLIDGSVFIGTDNARGRMTSQLLEAALTEEVVCCRRPYRVAVDAQTNKICFSLTSNGVSMTEDLAARRARRALRPVWLCLTVHHLIFPHSGHLRGRRPPWMPSAMS